MFLIINLNNVSLSNEIVAVTAMIKGDIIAQFPHQGKYSSQTSKNTAGRS